MAKKKLRVGVLFGGRSGEHEISLRSARSILAAIDRKKYDVVELGISKEGRWLPAAGAQKLLGESARRDGAASDTRGEQVLSLAAAAADPGAGARVQSGRFTLPSGPYARFLGRAPARFLPIKVKGKPT